MALEIKRLHLAGLTPPGDRRGQWPVHGSWPRPAMARPMV
jgi:hypothetical protein